MRDSSSTVQHREILWASVAVAAFSATGWTYFNIGFGPSFFPLLIGIFALRRLLTLEMAKKNKKHNLMIQYDIDPDREYAVNEQIDILSKIEEEYKKKGRIWSILGIISVAITVVGVALSLALAAACTTIASYCLIRYVRLHRLQRTIGVRINELSRKSSRTSKIRSE